MVKSIVLSLGFALTAFAGLNAATRIWQGGGGNSLWSTGTNWVGNTPPSAGDDLVFPSTAVDFMPDCNIANLALTGIAIDGGNNNYDLISSSNTTLSLASGAIIDASPSLISFSTQTFALNVDLLGPAPLTIENNNVSLISLTSFTEVVSGSAGVTISGGGEFVEFSGANTFIGDVTLNTNATLVVDSDSNLGDSSNTIFLNFIDSNLSVGATFTTQRSIQTHSSNIQVSGGFNFTHDNTNNLFQNLSGTTTLSNIGTMTLSGPNTNSYTGGWNLFAGILQGTTLTMNCNISTALNTSVVFLQGFNGNFTNTISGSGSVTKNMPGILNFTQAQSYTHGTTIAGGTLALVGSGELFSTGTVSLTSGSSIFDISAITAGSTTIGPLTGVANSEVSLGSKVLSTSCVATTTFGGNIVDGGLSGGLTKTGTGTFILTGTNNYIGGTTVANGTLALSGAGTLASTGPVSLTSSASIFDISAITASPSTIGPLTGVASSEVSLGSNVLSTSCSATTTFAGNIVDGGLSGGLTKTGTGTFILTGTNNYIGGTTVANGTLALSGSGTLASTGPVSLTSNTSIFDISAITSSPATIGPLTGIASSEVSLGSKVLSTSCSTTTTFAGNIVDGGLSGGLTKTGTGTFILTGTNNYIGGTTVANGTLALSGSGTLASTGPVSLTSNTSIFDISAITSSPATIGPLTGIASSEVSLGSNVLSTSCSTTTTFAGNIVDGGLSGGLTKTGTGIFILTGTNNYIGGTTVANGTLALSGAGTLASTGPVSLTSNTSIFDISAITSSPATIGPLTGIASSEVSLGSNVLSTSCSTTTTFAGNIVDGGLSGGLTKTGTGTFILTGTNNYIGGTTVANGTLALSGAGTLASTGPVSLTSSSSIFDISAIASSPATIGPLTGIASSEVSLGSNVLSTSCSTTTTFAGNIVDGGLSGGLTKTGTGTFILTGTNNYIGGTTVANGTLALSGSGTLASTGPVSLTSNTSIFDISAITSSPATIGPLTGIASSEVSLGSKVLSTSCSTTTTFAGNIVDGALGGGLTKTGTGTFILTGTNNYIGGTTVANGTLALSGSGTLASTGPVSLTSNASIFDISAITSSPATIGPLTGIASSEVSLGSKVLSTSCSTTTTFAGNIVDGGLSGGLIKTGTGTFILTGTNNYIGGTTVTGGALQGDTNSLVGNILIDSGTNLIFNQTADGTYSGQVSGAGALNKTGGGVLNLTGNSTYTGATTLSDGTLSVNGSITSPVTTLAGTTLKGTGTIAGNANISGTLQPGNSIGILTFVGDVVLSSGSTFVVELNPTTTSLLDITGNFTISTGDTLQILPDSGNYPSNMTYTIAQTTGAVTGTFDNITDNSAVVQFMVKYFPNHIDLILQTKAFSSVVLKGNPGKVAASLNNVIPAPGSDLALVFAQLSTLNQAQLYSAFNQMHPSVTTGLTLVQQNSFNMVSSALRKRTNLLHTKCYRTCKPSQGQNGPIKSLAIITKKLEEQAPFCNKQPNWEIWADASLDFYHQHFQSGNFGFHSKSTIGAAGMDYRFPSNVYLGLLGAYTYSNVHWQHAITKGNINSYYAGIYSSWFNHFAYLNLSAIGAYNNYGTSRKIQFGTIDRHAQERHPGLSLEGHIDLGFTFPAKRKFEWGPLAQADWVYIHQTRYQEHAAKSLNLHVSKYNANLLRSEIGLQSRYCISIGSNFILPSSHLSWVRETRFNGGHLQARLSNDAATNIAPRLFVVRGIYPSRNLAAVGAAITGLFLDETLSVSTTYEGQFGRKIQDNAVNLTVMYAF